MLRKFYVLVNERSEFMSRVRILLDPIQDTMSHLAVLSLRVLLGCHLRAFLCLMILIILKGIDFVLCKIL